MLSFGDSSDSGSFRILPVFNSFLALVLALSNWFDGPRPKTQLLRLYFTREIVTREEARWLLLPYGVPILEVSGSVPAVSFRGESKDERLRQVQALQDDLIGVAITAYIEIPPKVFVIPKSSDDLQRISLVLRRRGLTPTNDTYPTTADISVVAEDSEEWKFRLASESKIAMVGEVMGETGILYATGSFDLFSGPEYGEEQKEIMRFVSKSRFVLWDFANRRPLEMPRHRKLPPSPLTAQDRSGRCSGSSGDGMPTVIKTVVERTFQKAEIIPMGDRNGDPVVEYTIKGARGLVSKHWEYYQLRIEWSFEKKGLRLRGYLDGWGASGKKPPEEKAAYPEILEDEPTQNAKLQGLLNRVLESVETEFCRAGGGKT
jgi:hypothetical protein